MVFCKYYHLLFSAVVTTPSGKKEHPKIEDNGNGTVTIKYQPTEVGLHKLDVAYNNEPVNGSPFSFHVDASNAGYVSAYGPGLSHGTSGEECHFTIVTKDAGAGEYTELYLQVIYATLISLCFKLCSLKRQCSDNI